jgi:hypothetical protein
MDSNFTRELLERYPALDLEEEAPLREWLQEKYRTHLRVQGAHATAEIVAQVRHVESYLAKKTAFLRELSRHGLAMDDAADHHLALKLWVEECGYSILEGQDVYNAAEQVESEILRHLKVKELRPLVAYPEALTSRFHERDLDSPVKLDQKQRDFIGAYSEFVSKAIQLDYRILKFRRDVLGDSTRTISHEEATRLIRSPAVQLLALDFFTEAETPVVGHAAQRAPIEGAPGNLFVEPPAQFVDASGISVEPRSFRWITPSGVLEKHPVAELSVLGKLRDLCKYLSKHHPITEELAAYLVLTGNTLQVAPLSGRVSNTKNAKVGAYTYDHSTITLVVPSWVRPEQVQKAYAKLRAQAWAKNTYRSRSDRNIAIFRFVVERAKPVPPKDLIPGTRGTFDFPPWSGMVEEWNKPLPKGHPWRFDQPGYTAQKMFRNAFADGYKAVTGKKYYDQKPLTTKEEIRRELEDFQERLIGTLKSHAKKHDNRQPEEES